jgi:hypothetical protein
MNLSDFGDKDSIKREYLEPTLRENRQPKMECGVEEKREEDKLRKEQWSIIGSTKYLPSCRTIKELQPGVYTFLQTDLGIVLAENPLNTDDLISFPDSIFENVEKEVEKFWELGNSFKKYGFLHRRGYLFYGPAGGGKTCLTQRIIKAAISKGGLVFLCSSHPSLADSGLKVFREVEPNRNIICVFEDIDAITQQYGEAEVLMLLDGENQVDKVINIATTNYPERLDKRIVARPRRFDRIIKIGMPNEKIRSVYFKEKLKMNGADLQKWVTASEGFSFASLSELVISVKCLGNGFEDSVERLKNLTNSKYSSSEYELSKVGFES